MPSPPTIRTEPERIPGPLPETNLAPLFEDSRLIVCVGTGGVGKTTISACLAIEAARRGKRALVLTIDPARRLAGALGLPSLSGTPAPLPPDVLAKLGLRGPGEIHAMMLDMKGTFDDLVHRFAPDDDTRNRVLSNPIYQHVSDALAGSGEYAAMEKVFELASEDRFDVIVLDTPPSQHALDFLDAPERLLRFLDSKLTHLLIHPAMSAGRFGARLFQGATHRVLQMIERVSGIGFLEDISDFLLSFEGMSDGFRDRARRVQSLLLGPGSKFVLVCGPSPESARNGLDFLGRLDDANAPLRAIVVNRVRTWPGSEASLTQAAARAWSSECAADIDALAAALAGGAEVQAHHSETARAAALATSEYASLAKLDALGVAELAPSARRRGIPLRCASLLPQDVHDTEGLARVAEMLFETVESPLADEGHPAQSGGE